MRECAELGLQPSQVSALEALSGDFAVVDALQSNVRRVLESQPNVVA